MAARSRPKRLWLAVILNLLIASLSIVTALFVSLSQRVPGDLRPGALGLVTSLGFSGFLVVASVAALLGRPWARVAMLGGALAFWGTIILQNLLLLVQDGSELVPTQKLVANIVRSAIDIAINVWALTSARTIQFFKFDQAGT
jgi:hypothetical protein